MTSVATSLVFNARLDCGRNSFHLISHLSLLSALSTAAGVLIWVYTSGRPSHSALQGLPLYPEVQHFKGPTGSVSPPPSLEALPTPPSGHTDCPSLQQARNVPSLGPGHPLCQEQAPRPWSPHPRAPCSQEHGWFISSFLLLRRCFVYEVCLDQPPPCVRLHPLQPPCSPDPPHLALLFHFPSPVSFSITLLDILFIIYIVSFLPQALVCNLPQGRKLGFALFPS